MGQLKVIKYQLKTKLLGLHMHCNIDYINGHARIIGLIVNDELKDFSDYENKCSQYGISCYSTTGKKYFKLVEEDRLEQNTNTL